jgi:hypothetical protein
VAGCLCCIASVSTLYMWLHRFSEHMLPGLHLVGAVLIAAALRARCGCGYLQVCPPPWR